MKDINEYLLACKGVVNSFTSLLSVYQIDASLKNNYLTAFKCIDKPFQRWLKSHQGFKTELKSLYLNQEDIKLVRVQVEFNALLEKALGKKENITKEAETSSVKRYLRFLELMNDHSELINEYTGNKELSKESPIKFPNIFPTKKDENLFFFLSENYNNNSERAKYSWIYRCMNRNSVYRIFPNKEAYCRFITDTFQIPMSRVQDSNPKYKEHERTKLIGIEDSFNVC